MRKILISFLFTCPLFGGLKPLAYEDVFFFNQRLMIVSECLHLLEKYAEYIPYDQQEDFLEITSIAKFYLGPVAMPD